MERPPIGTVGTTKKPIDLNLISAAIHYGCMGLPQELVDHILDIFHDDFRTLKACSLTCKAMFASTRHLIHQILHLTLRNNESVLTQGERSDYHELYFLSYMGECGLLQYPRQVHIHNSRIFTPDTLLPHLHHFQSLDRVHTLTIEHFDAPLWANHYKTCFVNFYTTLASLTLSHPFGQYRSILRFAFQFPNLENLCLESLQNRGGTVVDSSVPTATDHSPPLCGHLRLAGTNAVTGWPAEFIHELSNGTNFRSIELESEVFGESAQRILHGCATTVESFTVRPTRTGMDSLSSILKERQLTLTFL